MFELGDLSSGDDDDDIHDPQLPINLSDVANWFRNWWTATEDLRFECFLGAMFDSNFL